MTRVNRFLLTNATRKRLVLTLEPWAEQYIYNPGQILEVRQECAHESETVELEYSDLGVTLFTGGVCKVYSNDEELKPLDHWVDRLD